MSPVAAATLGIGSEFWVEPETAPPIPVKIIAPGSWGLVHGVMDLPCMRLDNQEQVTVSIHIEAEVRLYNEPFEKAGPDDQD